MDFETAFALVVGIEGGYVNDPNDDGGETKFGISKRSYPDLDIPNLTLEDAHLIYRRDFWNKIRGDELPAGFALSMFETAIISGPKWAVQAAQLAVGETPDGSLGPKTLAALKAERDVDRLVARFTAKRVVRMSHDDDWPHFGEGWVFRVVRLALKGRA